MKETKKLYEFNCDVGRMGSLEGLFISTDEEMNKLKGREVYFGEVLGKHSEIFGEIEDNEIKIISEDQDLINCLFEVFKKNTLSGYNPLDYIEEE